MAYNIETSGVAMTCLWCGNEIVNSGSHGNGVCNKAPTFSDINREQIKKQTVEELLHDLEKSKLPILGLGYFVAWADIERIFASHKI